MAAQTIGEIWVAVHADTSKTGAELNKDLGKVNVSKAGKKAGDSFSGGFGTSIKKIAGLAAGVVAGVKVKNFLLEATTGYRDHVKIAAVTNQVIKTTGAAAKVTAAQVDALSSAIELKTGVDGDAIQSGANLLLTFTNVRNEAGKGNQIFDKATGLLADMSVALGQDAKGSAIQLGKALNDPITGVTALSKVGVSFTEQQKKQIKTLVESGNVLGAQKIILNELGKEFGGAAAAAADPADRAKVAYHQLQDQIGAGTLPVVNALATSFADFLAPALIDIASKHGPAVTAFLSGLAPKISASLGLLLTGDFDKKVGKALGGLSEDSPYVRGILTIRDSMIGLKGAFDVLATGNYTERIFGQAEDSPLVGVLLNIHNGLVGVYQTFKLLVSGDFTTKIFGQTEDSALVGILLNIHNGLVGVYETFKLLVTGDFTNKVFGQSADSGFVDVILKIRDGLKDLVANIANMDTSGLKDQFASLVDSAGKLLPIVVDFIKQMPGLKDVFGGTVTVLGFLADHTETLRKLLPALVAGVIAYKVAQGLANVAALLSVPTKVAEVIVNKQLVKSNRELIASRAGAVVTSEAETVATVENTAVKNAGIVSSLRARAASILQAAATGIATVATTIASAAMTALGVAVRFATGPIGLIIIGLTLLVGGLIYAYKHSETFRNIVNGVFSAVATVAKAVFSAIIGFVKGAIDWVSNNFPKIVGIITAPFTAVGKAASAVWSAITGFVKGTIDWITANFPKIVAIVTAPFTAVGKALDTAWGGIKTAAKNALKFVIDKFLGMVQAVLDGAGKAFGWVPGLGDKLKAAGTEFAKFRDSVNDKLDGINDEPVDIKVGLAYTQALGQATKKMKFADGGGVFGGTRGKDSVPALLMPDEHVWTTKEVAAAGGHGAMQRMRRAALAGELNGYANGGVVVRAGIPSNRRLQLLTNAAAGAVDHTSTVMANAIAKQMVAGPSGPPGAIKNYRGVRLNERTIRMLLAAEHLLRRTFHITQGSYSTRVAASGSTHAGGGAMDTNGPGGWYTAQNALRRVGFASWVRLPSQGPWGQHIHSIALGDTSASQAAKNQMAAFRRGGDGLGHGMSAGGRVGSYAEGAWRILQDQLAVVHKDEMVVPKESAGYLRKLLPVLPRLGADRVRSKLHQLHQAHQSHLAHISHLGHLNHLGRIPTRAGAIGADLDNNGVTGSRMHPDDIRLVGIAVADAVASNPLRVHLDGRQLDTAMSRRALNGGY